MVDVLARLYAAVSEVVEGAELDVSTRAAGWTARDLLLHQLLDAQRALVALATPASGAPDVDAVTYWRPFRPTEGDGGAAHAEFVRRSAAAYDGVAGLVGQWRETSAAVVRAARLADPVAVVATQGHALTVADLVSTLIVEVTVHLLDLTLELPGSPSDAALAHTRAVLDGLLGAPLPDAWDDRTAVLRATGRESLSAGDRALLGSDADRFPLLG